MLNMQDSHIWIFHKDHCAVVVTLGDAIPVSDSPDKHQLKFTAILVTHHHPDHIGSIKKLAELYNTPVYEPPLEKNPSYKVTRPKLASTLKNISTSNFPKTKN